LAKANPLSASLATARLPAIKQFFFKVVYTLSRRLTIYAGVRRDSEVKPQKLVSFRDWVRHLSLEHVFHDEGAFECLIDFRNHFGMTVMQISCPYGSFVAF
jgi:hypothetical protein